MSQAMPPDAHRLLQERLVLGRAARLLASAEDFDASLKPTLAADKLLDVLRRLLD